MPLKFFDGRDGEEGKVLGDQMMELGKEILLDVMGKYKDDPRFPMLVTSMLIASGAALGWEMQGLGPPKELMKKFEPFFLIGISKTLRDRVEAKTFHDLGNHQMNELAETSPDVVKEDPVAQEMLLGVGKTDGKVH